MKTRTIKNLFNGIVTQIITDCIISPCEEPEEIRNKQYKVKATWDTGSGANLITRSAAKKIGLIPKRLIKRYYKEKYIDAYVYEAYINVGNRIFLPIELMEIPFDDPFAPPIIIGMDVIKKGNFSIYQQLTGSVMEFTIPERERTDPSGTFDEFDTTKLIFIEDNDPFLNITYDKIRDILPLDVYVSKIDNTDSKIEASALWDSGAVHTMVSKAFIRKLNIIPSGFFYASSVNKAQKVMSCRLKIILTENFCFDVIAGIQDEDERIDIAIGMDIISQGNLAIKNINSEAEISFEKLHVLVPERINRNIGN
jgi:hypothetical protein